LVFSDDFSGGYRYEHWGAPFNGGVYWNGAFSWSGADVSVAPGSKTGNSMQVDITKHADGSWTTGGFNSFKAGQDILYGTVEFDAKVPEMHGTMAAILMWPTSDVWPGPEVDILETPNDDVMHTLHWNDNGNDAYSFVRNQRFDETRWQHYTLTWTQNKISIAVDGVGTVAEWHDHIPREPLGFGVMGYVGSPNDTWMGGAPSSSLPAGTAVTIEVDNFRMYQAPDVL
jgi:beta-glucanase (GH16 family)